MRLGLRLDPVERPKQGDWVKIHERMARDGRKSKVRKPSKAHEEGAIGPLRRWSPEQPIPSAK